MAQFGESELKEIYCCGLQVTGMLTNLQPVTVNATTSVYEQMGLTS